VVNVAHIFGSTGWAYYFDEFTATLKASPAAVSPFVALCVARWGDCGFHLRLFRPHTAACVDHDADGHGPIFRSKLFGTLQAPIFVNLEQDRTIA